MTSQPILTELLGQKKYFRCESLWSVDQHELFGSRDTVPALADACVSGACNFTYGVACVLSGSCESLFEPCLLKWRTNSTSSSRQGNDCAFCSSRKIKNYLCSPPCHWAVLLFLLTSFVWLLNDTLCQIAAHLVNVVMFLLTVKYRGLMRESSFLRHTRIKSPLGSRVSCLN